MIIESPNRTIIKQEIVIKTVTGPQYSKLKYGSTVHGYKLIKLS
jgi:hypothetical protein